MSFILILEISWIQELVLSWRSVWIVLERLAPDLYLLLCWMWFFISLTRSWPTTEEITYTVLLVLYFQLHPVHWQPLPRRLELRRPTRRFSLRIWPRYSVWWSFQTGIPWALRDRLVSIDQDALDFVLRRTHLCSTDIVWRNRMVQQNDVTALGMAFAI